MLDHRNATACAGPSSGGAIDGASRPRVDDVWHWWPGGCTHQPPCPPATSPDHAAAAVVASHPEQGWWLLCNGIVCFDDTGEILPNGHAVAPQGRSLPRGTHAA